MRADTELNIPGYRIHWNDEFEGATVDTSRWDVNIGVNAWYQRASDGRFVEPHWFNEEFEPWLQAGTINGERQYYTPDNVSISSGVLEIRADEETVTDPVGLYDPAFHKYTSGKLNTADEFQFTYGIVKWRAQLPSGQGLWPALWMLNAPNPWYWDDEIDVMEARGSQPTVTTSAHHYKVDTGGGNLQNFYNAANVDTGVNLQSGFHEYSLLWAPNLLTTWMDNQQVLYDTQAVPDNPMFLIMNAAVGGGFGGDPDETTVFPTHFKIDWVRVWQEAPTPSDLASGGFEDYQGPQWDNWNTLDDGNLSTYSSGALHGASSVLIDRRNVVDTGTAAPNLLTDGTATEWRAWLNLLDAEGAPISGDPIDPATIPAVVTDDGATLPIHQTAPSPQANAVIFRQLTGASVQGLDLTYTGTVAIDEAFAPGARAIAFIRIFDAGYGFTDVATSVISGGQFTLHASIPASGVPFIQVGLETSGVTGDVGQLTATSLFLVDDGAVTSGPENSTGFNQTVAAVPGEAVRYGVMAANNPANPIGPGAEGHLRLEFFDSGGAFISETAAVIVDEQSPSTPLPFALEAVTPAGAAYARLSIGRITTDPDTDTAGSFIADTAFLHTLITTELPLFTSMPLAAQTVNAGQAVTLDISISSPTAVAYQWYHDGQKTGTAQDLAFTATPTSGGLYFVVTENAAGPVIGAITELTVLTPDTDGDLISDYDETVVHGTNPNLKDTDGDGFNDYEEIFVLLSDPLDPMSVFRITGFVVSGDSVQVTFQSVSGVTYRLEGSPDLSGWQTIGAPIPASGISTTVNETVPVTNPPLRFFRIITP